MALPVYDVVSHMDFIDKINTNFKIFNNQHIQPDEYTS